MKIKKTVITFILLFCLAFPAHAHAGLWDKFVSWVDNTIETVVEIGEDIVEGIVTIAEEIITTTIEFVVDVGEWLYDTANTVVEGALNFFFGLADGVVKLLSFFGLDVDISHWFSSGVYNSEDTAELWTIDNYFESDEDAGYLADFRQRQADYIDIQDLSADDSDKESHEVLRNFLGLPLDEAMLSESLAELPGKKNLDFRLIELIRIMADSDDYDDMILEAISGIPFWQDEDVDGKHVYTSENHVLMWMSSGWLLYEFEGWEVAGGHEALRERLVRYLEVKNEYGIYESLSQTYTRFSLRPLLNLYDYSQDEEIKELAGKAALIMLNDIVMVTNDLGLPVAPDARAYGVGVSINRQISQYAAMITGLGDLTYGDGSDIDFFATTTLDVSSVTRNRMDVLGSEVNLSYTWGHSVYDVDTIWEGLDQRDKVIFAQSGGAYAHPELLDDILDVYLDPVAGLNFFFEDLITDSNLTDDMVDMAGVLLTETSAPFTTSSIIMKKTMDLYRHGNVQLASLQDFHAGNAGWQQQPWKATTGLSVVTTRTGSGEGGWKAGGQEQMNTHLPYIRQNENVALILYKAAMELRFMDDVVSTVDFIPVDDFETAPVNLIWPEEDFDETSSYGNWLFGREGDGYVAIYRHCTGTKTFDNDDGEEVELYSCSAEEQVWAAVVGNAETHGSFTDFIFTISEAKMKSKWYWSWAKTRHVWQTTLEVDGKTLSYAWEANVDDLTDDEMWELAGVTDMNSIEVAQVGGYQVTNVDDSQTGAGCSDCSSGTDILLHQNVSYADSDPTILRMWEESDGACYVVNKEDQSLDSETTHADESVDIVAFKNNLFSGGEANKVDNINHEWTTVDLKFSYTNPVVFASVIGVAGSDPVVTEVANITSNSFDVRVAEFEWDDGEHTYEIIHYVVMEAGNYTIANGVKIKVGAVMLETEFDGTPNFETVEVGLNNYLLVSQVQGADSGAVMDTRISKQSETGSFDISLMVQEGDRDSGETINAVVGYMAVGTDPITISKKIALKGAHGKYLTATGNGGDGKTANCNATSVGAYETIVLTGDSEKQGCIVNGDTVWLQTTSGYYYSAQLVSSGAGLDVDRTRLGSYEKFELINHTDTSGCLQNGDVISLYSQRHGRYVVAESNGTANANRTAIGSWEKFIVYLSDPGISQMVWGVNASDQIYQGNNSSWAQISGGLKHVSVGADGTVWGVNSSDNIYRRDGNSWTQISGGLKQISVGSATQVWG
ncbi:MAG: hypothetical protein GY751_24370, partial [Bacteroidetes bacterium]|nr:hypothetical protein [Bacteroidota bacterium]